MISPGILPPFFLLPWALLWLCVIAVGLAVTVGLSQRGRVLRNTARYGLAVAVCVAASFLHPTTGLWFGAPLVLGAVVVGLALGALAGALFSGTA